MKLTNYSNDHKANEGRVSCFPVIWAMREQIHGQKVICSKENVQYAVNFILIIWN